MVYPTDLILNLALLCLLVRMTSDQSSGHGNLSHFLVIMICMHLLGKGELFFFLKSEKVSFFFKSSLSFKVLSSEAKKIEYLLLIANCVFFF